MYNDKRSRIITAMIAKKRTFERCDLKIDILMNLVFPFPHT